MSEEKRGPGRPPKAEQGMRGVKYALLRNAVTLEGNADSTLSKAKFSKLTKLEMDSDGNLYASGKENQIFVPSSNVVFSLFDADGS